MKTVALLALCAFVGANANGCYTRLVNRASGAECLSAHKSFNDVNLFFLQKMINTNLEHSLKFTLLASHFDKDTKNRNGFKKYFEALADEHWADALDLVDYVTLRGGHLNEVSAPFKNGTRGTSYGLAAGNLQLRDEKGEKHSLGHALDITRDLSIRTRQLIHKTAAHGTENEDATLAHFLEEKFTSKYVQRVRELSGYVTILSGLTAEEEGVALDLFDQHLG